MNDNILKAINLVGITASDIKDVIQSPDLIKTDLLLTNDSIVSISNNKVSLKQNNKTLVTIKLK